MGRCYGGKAVEVVLRGGRYGGQRREERGDDFW